MSGIDREADAELLKALAHATRLAILDALVGREFSVGQLEAASGVSQPVLSQQLAILRGVGLVSTRRAAKQIFYRLHSPQFVRARGLIDRFAAAATADPGALPRQDASMRGGGAAMFARMAPVGSRSR